MAHLRSILILFCLTPVAVESYKVLMCTSLHITMSRFCGESGVDRASVDMALDLNNPSVIHFNNFTQQRSDPTLLHPLLPPGYFNRETQMSPVPPEWPYTVTTARDGPATLIFRENIGIAWGYPIDVPKLSKSFFNVNGTFFAKASPCAYGEHPDNFTYSVCCTDMLNLDVMPSIDNYACNQIEAETRFVDDKNATLSSYRVQYDLADSFIKISVLNTTKSVHNTSMLLYVNHNRLTDFDDGDDDDESPVCISQYNTDKCQLKVKNDLYLDGVFSVVITSTQEYVDYTTINGILIQRNNTWVTPDYTLYSPDNSCWTRNESKLAANPSVRFLTKACCTSYTVNKRSSSVYSMNLTVLAICCLVFVHLKRTVY